MNVRAHIVAARASDGSTRLRRIGGGGPLTVRPTSTPDQARAHLVAGSFGPLGGDALELRVTLEPGARLQVCAMAAMLVLPSRGAAPSSLRILVELAESARLTMAMPPTIVCAGARHSIETDAVLAADAELLLREETVRGRTGERGGDITQHTRVDVAAIPVLRQAVSLAGDAEDPWNPRAVGALLRLRPETPAPCASSDDEPKVRAAWMALPGAAGLQFVAVDDDPLCVRQLLDGAQRQLPRYVENP